MAGSISLTQILDSIVRYRPCGVMTDIDGTISHIASSPDAATVDARARAALVCLASKLELIAAVSGRAAVDARAMVGIDDLVYSGNHGMEWWRNGELSQSDLATSHVPKITSLLDSVGQNLQIDGMRLEHKGLTASIHVRETDDPELAERRVLEKVERYATELGLRVTRGRLVIEIRPPIDLNKGSAVLDLIQRFQLKAGIYYGDDVTDVDAFRTLQRLRTDGTGQFFAIGVRGTETPSLVIEYADATVEGVEGVIDSLERLGSMLESTQS